MMDWLLRIPTLSINPEMATREDVARLAAELMEARHELERLSELVGDVDKEIIELILDRE